MVKISSTDFNQISEKLNKSCKTEKNKIGLLFNEIKSTKTGNTSNNTNLPDMLSNFSGNKTSISRKNNDIMSFLNKKTGKPDAPVPENRKFGITDIMENMGSSTANGKIDRNFRQGKEGDCWLLAGIESAAQNPKALAQLNNQIKVDGNGNVTVYLKGVNRRYTVSKEELQAASKLSKGDLDVKAVEIAIQKYCKETGKTINGGTVKDFYKIMFGTPKYEKAKSLSNSTLNELRNGKRIGIAGCVKTNIKAHDKYGNEVPIVNDHMYAIKSVGKDTIELVNPWDTSKTIIMSLSDFKKAFSEVSTIKI